MSQEHVPLLVQNGMTTIAEAVRLGDADWDEYSPSESEAEQIKAEIAAEVAKAATSVQAAIKADMDAAATSAAAAATAADRAESAAAGVDQVVPDAAQVADAVLRAEAAAERAEASGGGIIVVSSEEEAAALPIGTVYVIAAEVTPGEPDTPEPAPVTIVGTTGENITTDTFTPTIPNATTGDTIIIAANTKAVGGPTLTAPAGFTTLVDGYWKGTQRSWVLTGPWSNDLTITADDPLELAYAAVAVRGATSVTAGMVKDRETEPAESTTVTAPAVEHGTNDLAIGIAFERTSATETAEQVTVNEGWTIEHYTAQGENFQTALIGTGGTGDMVVTYPNAQAKNGVGVQVVAHA
ncbi:collagen-like protein [Corynebacterium phoceense]|uniref:collagen-like protein n=1 Tax=Corynebacterium phoceense TaxID=1686286 RepID=UPI00211CF107|nr:collagen-like protein [Corynebacterium phoceense]MCQ9342039.1 collagen-like protein [Corynebacterium phoceense]